MRNVYVGIRKKMRYLDICMRRIWDHEYVENVLLNEKKLIFHNGTAYLDKVIYLIDLRGNNTGFFAQCRLILALLQYAEMNGYMPVIRMSDFAYKQRKYGLNVYDYFFIQPSTVGINDINKAKNVIYADIAQVQKENILPGGYFEKDNEIGKEVLMWKKYFQYNEQIFSRLSRDSAQILGKRKDTVLGIHIRGGDYRQHWKNHPVQLEPKDYYEYIDEAIQNGFRRLFVATDDQKYLHEFVKRYGDCICFYDDVIRTDDKEGVHSKKYKLNNGYRLGYEALRDMYTLSLCEGLVAGLSHVGTIARIEKLSREENYRFIKLISKGLY